VELTRWQGEGGQVEGRRGDKVSGDKKRGKKKSLKPPEGYK